MSITHNYRNVPWFAFLSMGMSLGCTTPESDGSGGGAPCPAAPSSSTGHSGSVTSSSTGFTVNDIPIPDCPPGVTWFRGIDGVSEASPYTPTQYDHKFMTIKSDFDGYGYMQIDGPSNEFIFATWASLDSAYQSFEPMSGVPIQITGAWRRADQTHILAIIEGGSTLTYYENPSTKEIELFTFRFRLFPGSVHAGCMRR